MKNLNRKATFFWSVFLVTVAGVLFEITPCKKHSPIPESKTDLRPNQEVSLATHSVPSVADLTQQAKNALPRDGFPVQLSPMFPSTWPPVVDSTLLEWFAYEKQALAAGIVAYQIQGPVFKVTLKSEGGEPHVVSIDTPTANGHCSQMAKNGKVDISGAEQAMIDILRGNRPIESSRAELSLYLKWAESTPVIGPDLRHKKSNFFAWLEIGK